MNLDDVKNDIFTTLALYYEVEAMDLSDICGTSSKNEINLLIKSNTIIDKDEIIKVLGKVNVYLHIVVYNNMVSILFDINEPHIS